MKTTTKLWIGIGILNIMITKLNAAPIPRSGACRVFSVFLAIAEAAAHIGSITA